MIKGGVVAAAAVMLVGCESILGYPKNDPPVTMPVTMSEAMTRAQTLQGKYLDAAGQQVTAAKLANFGFLGAGATAIGAALFGAHRDLITGAAFTGGVLYAGSSLFGSPAQRMTYRTGAQALSCAITRYAPLMVLAGTRSVRTNGAPAAQKDGAPRDQEDGARLDQAYNEVRAAEGDYRQGLITLEEKLNLLAIPGLSSPAYDTVNRAVANVNTELVAAGLAVEAALAPGATADKRTAAHTAIGKAQTAIGQFNLAAAAARAFAQTAVTAEGAELDRIISALSAIVARLDKPEDTVSKKYAADAKAKVEAARATATRYEEVNRNLTALILDAHALAFASRLEVLSWRLTEPAAQSVRTRAVRLASDLKKAGTELSKLVDNIHFKVLGELERAEPDRRTILEALSASTGMSIAYAKLTDDERNLRYPRTAPGPSPVAAPPAAPPVGPEKTTPGESPPPPPTVAAPAPGAAPAAPVLSPQVKADVDRLVGQMPNLDSLVARTGGERAVAASLESSIAETQKARTTVQRAVARFGAAFATITDILETVETIDFNNTRTECEQLVNPGLEPLKVSTNQVQMSKAATQPMHVYVYGGTPGYRVQFDKALVGFTSSSGYDPQSGEFRYELKPSDKIVKDQTYTMTVLDRRNTSAVVTITTTD